MSFAEYEGGNPIPRLDPLGTSWTGSDSNDLVVLLLDLEARKDYDWRANGGKPGPNNKSLWKRIQQVKSELYATETIFAVVERPIKETDCADKIANRIANHMFVATAAQPWRAGQTIGYGITYTKAKAGDLPSAEIYQPGELYTVHKLSRNGDPVEGLAKGSYSDSYHATDAEIRNSIRNHKMTQDYTSWWYNCGRWAWEAVASAGLRLMSP